MLTFRPEHPVIRAAVLTVGAPLQPVRRGGAEGPRNLLVLELEVHRRGRCSSRWLIRGQGLQPGTSGQTRQGLMQQHCQGNEPPRCLEGTIPAPLQMMTILGRQRMQAGRGQKAHDA